MAGLFSISQKKKISLFLNASFLFLLSFYLTTSFLHLHHTERATVIANNSSFILHGLSSQDACAGLNNYSDYRAKCLYVKTQIACKPKGYINYLQIFYCTCGKFHLLGYLLLLVWLAVLFYLMGDTAANYFCPSLESLSKLLHLSPPIAGVTLLSLGNGASDVFASIVSFTRSGNGDVGLNGVLGGALFVSTSVVGIISIVISPHEIPVDKLSFIRDVLFFLFTLSSLLIVIFIGEITLWGALCFLSIYLFYVGTVSASYFLTRRRNGEKNPNPTTEIAAGIPVIPKSFYPLSNDDLGELGIPLMGYVDHDEKPIPVGENGQSQQQNLPNLYPTTSYRYYVGKLLLVLELPLYLPRRLTIPLISEERWCKAFAVASVTLAPILLAEIYNTQIEKHMVGKNSLVIYMVAGLIGMVLGNLALVKTKKSNPPNTYLLPWHLGGFLMSVTWTYITAEELVSLLVSLGIIFGINPSVLGLTVLAWGNSLGDLIANVTLAMNGGADGAQIAISGCYAGPMFNTLMGLGISFVLSSLYEYPETYVIPGDSSLFETLGFLIGGLLWAMVILPRKKMKLDKFLGFGLLAIYSCFLFLRLARALGVLRFRGYSSFSLSS